MRIKKRNGKFESLSFDKIKIRNNKLANDISLGKIKKIDTDLVSQKVIQQITDGISTEELDILSADICISLSIDNPGYGELASRIYTNNIQKKAPLKFSESMETLYKYGIINETFMKNLDKNKDILDESIVSNRDYLIDYFGSKTLEKGYLLNILEKEKNILMETPQYMWMRVSLALHGEDIDSVLETYENLSLKNFIHATPTLFNAGLKRQQLSSCYLLGTSDDVKGIFKTMGDVAQISKYAGGIGITCSNIRAKGSIIRGTNGRSDGILPMLKVYNEISRYINQAGRRNGSFAMYIDVFHADIEEFLEMKKNTGDVNLRARDLFYGLWVSDLFMEKVEKDDYWYLMCPDECKGLVEAYGEEFKFLYKSYVEKGMYRKKLKARELWTNILIAQIETGTPYICYKDSVNIKNNQKNLGSITSSNLCVEVMLYHDDKEYGVCNIATLSLGSCIENGNFNFEKLQNLARIATINLNKVIDLNYYPTPETKKSNLNHRPIAVGVQGLYDAFIKLRLPFTSNEAKTLNKKIFECIQYSALKTSCELAKKDGKYFSFDGSPSSKGIFQHNMWGIDEKDLMYDWESLRKMVMKYGLRNSLVTALPPTASTANILGNTSSFETITSNIFTRTVLSGNFPIVNKYLVDDLIKLNLWNTNIKNQIIMNNGSIQSIDSIPDNIKELYKTSWETSQKDTIDMSADRSPFIDQSQSLNIFMANATIAKLSSMHFYGWKKGLKTGMYYLRSQPISTAEKITIESNYDEASLSCSIDNKEACAMCEG